jgi:UDP-N-acetylglucosamine 2-epimerase
VFVGDVMLDAVQQLSGSSVECETLHQLGLARGEYALVTLHRAENTDDLLRLTGVMSALERMKIPVIFPIHPRLKRLLGDQWMRMLSAYSHLCLIEPVGYLEMLKLEKSSRFILTDSGGVQKEAYFLGVPCLTLRDETEWVETLEGGWNKLVGTNPDVILAAVDDLLKRDEELEGDARCLSAFGNGCAGQRSVEEILRSLRAA